MAGSMTSFFVLVPAFGYVGQFVGAPIPPGTEPLGGMAPDAIFRMYVRPIGIGGIFAAGLLSIIKMSPVIVEATKQAFGEVARLVRGGAVAGAAGAGPGGVDEVRTERSLPMSLNLLGIVAIVLAIFLYFRFSVLAGEPRATAIAAVSALMTVVIAFLFASVSAWAIAMISITPISGMTLTTLIVTAVALDPSLVRSEAVAVDVDTSGGTADGQTIADWRGLWGRAPNADVAVEADAEVFTRRLVERVGALAAARARS